MKKITAIVFLFLLTGFAAFAQSKSDKLYNYFEDRDGITSFSFSKNMVDFVDVDLGENANEQNVTGDLHQVRFLSYNPEKGALSGSEFHKKAVSLLPSRYKKYKDPEGDDSDSEIWLLGRGKKFSECHLFLKNDNENQMRFVVSFYGDFYLNDLAELKNKGKEFSAE